MGRQGVLVSVFRARSWCGGIGALRTPARLASCFVVWEYMRHRLHFDSARTVGTERRTLIIDVRDGWSGRRFPSGGHGHPVLVIRTLAARGHRGHQPGLHLARPPSRSTVRSGCRGFRFSRARELHHSDHDPTVSRLMILRCARRGVAASCPTPSAASSSDVGGLHPPHRPARAPEEVIMPRCPERHHCRHLWASRGVAGRQRDPHAVFTSLVLVFTSIERSDLPCPGRDLSGPSSSSSSLIVDIAYAYSIRGAVQWALVSLSSQVSGHWRGGGSRGVLRGRGQGRVGVGSRESVAHN